MPIFARKRAATNTVTLSSFPDVYRSPIGMGPFPHLWSLSHTDAMSSSRLSLWALSSKSGLLYFCMNLASSLRMSLSFFASSKASRRSMSVTGLSDLRLTFSSMGISSAYRSASPEPSSNGSTKRSKLSGSQPSNMTSTVSGFSALLRACSLWSFSISQAM